MTELELLALLDELTDLQGDWIRVRSFLYFEKKSENPCDRIIKDLETEAEVLLSQIMPLKMKIISKVEGLK